MTTAIAHDAYVAGRFDRLHARFKRDVPADDVRLRALTRALGPISGRQVLDLGCGKGRFAARLNEAGAKVIGLDLSAEMLAGAGGVAFGRVRASARRLPFGDRAFDAVVAVEVFEHLDRDGLDAACTEVGRVLKPGGLFAVVDKNAGSWNARRPWLPNLAVKWIDERRGRWMYPAGGPMRERWFWPGWLRRRLARRFVDLRVEHLLTPDEAAHTLFRLVPGARLMTLWTARAPGRTP
jgi:SAM-dependent methyltransferase